MNVKHNKTLSRVIVLAGTTLAGVGIWAAVVSSPSVAAKGTTSNTAVNPNFSTNDNFLTQPYVPNGSNFNAQIPASGTSPRLRTRGS